MMPNPFAVPQSRRAAVAKVAPVVEVSPFAVEKASTLRLTPSAVPQPIMSPTFVTVLPPVVTVVPALDATVPAFEVEQPEVVVEL